MKATSAKKNKSRCGPIVAALNRSILGIAVVSTFLPLSNVSAAQIETQQITWSPSATYVWGSGSYSWSTTGGSVSLSDLTDFQYSWTWDLGAAIGTFDYGLSDLTSFSLDRTNGAQTLSFTTNAVPVASVQNFGGATTTFYPEYFNVADNVGTAQLGATGSMTFAPVPLPAGLWLFLSGSVGLIGVGVRRARRESGGALQPRVGGIADKAWV